MTLFKQSKRAKYRDISAFINYFRNVRIRGLSLWVRYKRPVPSKKYLTPNVFLWHSGDTMYQRTGVSGQPASDAGRVTITSIKKMGTGTSRESCYVRWRTAYARVLDRFLPSGSSHAMGVRGDELKRLRGLDRKKEPRQFVGETSGAVLLHCDRSHEASHNNCEPAWSRKARVRMSACRTRQRNLGPDHASRPLSASHFLPQLDRTQV